MSLNKKVLIVDDDPILLATVEKGLGQEGFEVKCAPDGTQGIEIARDWIPDAIILDVLLPDIDGTEVAGRLQEMNHTQHIPILYLTGLESSEDQHALKADHVLNKPVNLDALVHKIHEILHYDPTKSSEI